MPESRSIVTTRRDALRFLSGCAIGTAGGYAARALIDRDRSPREIAAERPRVLLKADDYGVGSFRPVAPGWLAFTDYIATHDLKANIGLVGKSLEHPDEAFISFTRDLQRSGRFEIWNHGYDHLLGGELTERVNGEEVSIRYDEFRNTSFEYQRRHLARTQELAHSRLGVTICAFGAPGNQIDAVTAQVVDEAPDIKIWFFGLGGSHKRVIPRLVDIEDPLAVPNFDRFTRDYQRQPEHDVLALQCHPHNWTATQLGELQRIVEFLQARRAAFVLCREL